MNCYIDHKQPAIIGTSGLTPREARQYCQQTDFPLVIVPNFSRGFRLFFQQAQSIAPHYANIQIIETHHQTKKDAPSGSSLFLADALSYPPSDIMGRQV